MSETSENFVVHIAYSEQKNTELALQWQRVIVDLDLLPNDLFI